MSIITENTGFNDGDIVYCDKHTGAHEVTAYCTWCVSAEPDAEVDNFRVTTLTPGPSRFDRGHYSRLMAELDYTARVIITLQLAWASGFQETTIEFYADEQLEKSTLIHRYQTVRCRACNDVIAWNPVGMEWVSRHSDRVEHYVNICSAQFGGHSPRV